ncbi:nucleotidyltransferase family protein [Corynebacterium sp.]|uniref:nucleotidyltransferase family protein n=1 Tax=Corynebacterium sp. TaxID=1720 RepID=UPI003B3B11A9
MSTDTAASISLREKLEARRAAFQELLDKYGASNPRLFGSVARGEAHEGSDIDILVDMDPHDGNLLMRASRLMEETRELFRTDGITSIDIFPSQLLKREIARTVEINAVALL